MRINKNRRYARNSRPINSSRLNCTAERGYSVSRNEAQEAYNFACEVVGKDQVDADIVESLGYDALAKAMTYCFNLWDFEEWEAYKNGDEIY